MERVFLVGCARSGTTLLQSLLSCHSKITSFPETQYFPILIGNINQRLYFDQSSISNYEKLKKLLFKLRNHLDLAYPRINMSMGVIRTLYDDIEMDVSTKHRVKASISIKACVNNFIENLDYIAHSRACDVWIEKTPNHLFYVKEIENSVLNAKFIHIVRKGEDVVASICDAARKYPIGNDFLDDVDRNIVRWNNAIKVSSQYKEKANHKIIFYDHLIADPESTLKSIHEGFLGKSYENNWRESRIDKKIFRKDESWKNSAIGKVDSKNTSKLEQLFTPQQIDHIKKTLLPLEMAITA